MYLHTGLYKSLGGDEAKFRHWLNKFLDGKDQGNVAAGTIVLKAIQGWQVNHRQTYDNLPSIDLAWIDVPLI